MSRTALTRMTRAQIGGRARRAIRIAAAVVTAFFVLEGILALVLPAPPVDRAPLVKVMPDPRLGYVLVPNQRTFTYGRRVETNALGLRERAIDPDVLLASEVVICAGGSETFGKGVDAEDAYPRQLERLLRSSTSTSALVINAGVPDYNLEQSVAWLRERSAAFSPRKVVLAFYWNDLFFDPTVGRPPESSVPAPRQWALRRWAERTGVLEWLAPIYTRSRVLYWTRNRAKKLLGRRLGHLDMVWRDALLQGEARPDLEAAWTRARAVLAELVELGRSRGFEPVLLVLPIEQQIEEAGHAPAFQSRATELARSLGLRAVDPTGDFVREARAGRGLFIPYDGRPNEEGHRLIARALASAFDPSSR